MSDRIAVMNLGRVLQVAPPRQIYAAPATRFVADFIGSTNFLSGALCYRQKGLALVDLDGMGMCRAPWQEGLAAGQRLTLAVRPEQLRLSCPAGEADWNHLTAVLEEIIFIGEDTQYILRLPSGERLVLRQQNQTPAAGEADLQPGQQLEVFWPPASTSILLE